MPSDNVPITAGSGTSVRTLADSGSVEWPVGVVCYATTVSAGANALAVVTPSAGLPVAQQGTWTVTANAGTGTLAVSAASLPLPSGAATVAKQPALGTAGSASADVLTIQGVASMTPLAVSAASLPLPSGAATSAKQPAIGTAGTAASDVLTIQGIASMTALAVSASSLPLPTGASTESTLSTLSGKVTACNTGSVTVSAALPAGTNTIGGVSLQAVTSGGTTAYSYLAAASANQDSQVVKASAGQVYSLALFNTSAAVRYVKLYNKATAPTSADTPVLRYFLPAGGGAVIPATTGIAFATGVAFRITTGVADNDANAATANDVIVTLTYK